MPLTIAAGGITGRFAPKIDSLPTGDREEKVDASAKERNAERPKGLKVMTKEELIEASYRIAGGYISNLTYEQLTRLMTITQFVTDLCLREIEDRGELAWAPGVDGGMIPIVPYNSDVMVETVLNRPLPAGVVKL